MSQHPYEKLVEALRKTGGWTHCYSGREWLCQLCNRAMDGSAREPFDIKDHAESCPIRLALEAAPPTMPKLTPLPVTRHWEHPADWTTRLGEWVKENIESLIKQQENTVEPHNVANAPTQGDIDALRADLIARINQADRDVRAIIDHERERVENRLDALESRNVADHTDKPLPDGLNLTGKPKCELCGDTKLIDRRSEDVADVYLGKALCPCVKVGDVVSAEVANLLPPGSRVLDKIFPQDVWWERTRTGWENNSDNFPATLLHELTIPSWQVLRIGPAPATDDVPDKAEEIAREFEAATHANNWGTMEAAMNLCDLLRKHHVGQPIPLADLIADPRLRPVVEVVQAVLQLIESCNRNDAFMFEANGVPDFINKAVYALPPDLRAAVENVK